MHNATTALGVLVLLSCANAEQPEHRSPPGVGPPTHIELGWQLEPAREEYVCRYFVVPAAGLDVARAVYELGEGSHHLLVWSTSLTADALDSHADLIRECDGDAASHASIDGLLLGAQPGTGAFSFPPGAALRLRGDQVLLIEHHAVNVSADAADVQAALTLYPADAPVREEVGLLHYYDWAIRVLPESTATARMRCVVPKSVELLSVHGHMHARGSSFRAWTMQGAESRPFYRSVEWDSAPEALAPPVWVSGGDAIEFECAYSNSGATTVFQGLSARDDEMCSFTAFYVAEDARRLDGFAELCGEPGSGILGQGTLDCAGIEACLWNVLSTVADPVLQRNGAQNCWLDGCSAATLSFRDFAVCRATHCGAACGVLAESAWLLASRQNEPECRSCIALSCAENAESCSSSTCGP